MKEIPIRKDVADPTAETRKRRGEKERGSALVITLVFLAILTVIGILIVSYTSTGLHVVGEMRQEAILSQATDTAIEEMKTFLWSRHPWNADADLSAALASSNRLAIADTPLDTNLSNLLLTRQLYNVRLDSINGPDLVKITATATHSDTGQAKQVEVVLHYFAGNVDQAGQGAENSNVIN